MTDAPYGSCSREKVVIWYRYGSAADGAIQKWQIKLLLYANKLR